MSNALWCNRQISIRVEGPDGEWTVDVGKPFARIGSDARSDVILDGAGLPRLSHYLHATECGIFVKPLVAMLDGHETCGRWLSPDCAVEVGAYRFFASFADGVPPVAGLWPPLDEKGSAELPVPVIYILVNEARRASYRAYRKLTVVGREKPSALRLGSQFVSLTHCVLYWDQGKLWFVDLLSANGTEQGGRRRDADRLWLGYTIKLGDVRLGLASTSDEMWLESPGRETDQTGPRSSDERRVDPATGSSVEGSGSPHETSRNGRGKLEERNSPEVGRAAAPPPTVALTSSYPEAIADMQRQLEAQTVAWEAERDQKRRVLRGEHEEIDKHFAEIQSWRDELNHRSHQLKHDLSQLVDTSHELAKQREELEAVRATTAVQHTELDREREALEQLRETVRQSRRELEDQSQEQARLLDTRTEDLRRRQMELDQEVQSLAREREQLERRQRLVESREEEIVQTLHQANEGTEQSVAWVAARVRELEQQTAEQDKREVELEERGIQMRTRFVELAEREAALDGRTAELNECDVQLSARNAALDAREAVLSSRSTELHEREARLNSQLAELDVRNATLRSHADELDAHGEALRARSAELAAQQESLNARSADLERRAAELDQCGAQRGERRADLDLRAAQLESERAELDEECSVWSARKIVMEALSAQLDEQSGRLERERAELTDEQARCHADREELVKIREWLDAERRDLEARSRRDLAELREDREELAEEWARLADERGRLEQFAMDEAERLVDRTGEDQWPGCHDDSGPDKPAGYAEETEEKAAPETVGQLVLGAQFEQVNPMLIGDQDRGVRSRAAADRPPIDPVAEEAYDELVDRIVQFNYSKKKKWYAFWR